MLWFRAIMGWSRGKRWPIINFHHQFPLEGYRRLTFMMLDRDVVAVSPSSTYRVLKAAGLLQRWNPKASRKGNGFQQPLAPHSQITAGTSDHFVKLQSIYSAQTLKRVPFIC
jgi:hypothetical protein